MILASGLCFARVIPTPGLALEKASLIKAPKPVQDSPNQSAPCNWACNRANLNSGNDRFFPKSVNFVNKHVFPICFSINSVFAHSFKKAAAVIICTDFLYTCQVPL